MATQIDSRMIRDFATDVVSAVSNFLNTENVSINSLNVNSLSGSNFNTLTTTVSALSSDGTTPFAMTFTNGLLTSINF